MTTTVICVMNIIFLAEIDMAMRYSGRALIHHNYMITQSDGQAVRRSGSQPYSNMFCGKFRSTI